jgi:hypothetical protein
MRQIFWGFCINRFGMSSTPRLADYEYLLEFEAKIGTARKVVLGIYEEPIFCKNPRNSASLPCPNNI